MSAAGERTALSDYLVAGHPLSPTELALLERLERKPRRFARGERVRGSDESTEVLYVVRDGWISLGGDLPDGRRYLTRTFHRGDLIGLHELAEHRSTGALTATTDAVLCPFPREEIAAIVVASPRLATLLLAFAARDQVLQADLLRATGRLSARMRVAFLLLTYLHRLRASDPEVDDAFTLGLDQSQFGDLVGLTNVSVSKAFTALEGDGAIVRRRQWVMFTDVVRLSREVGFVDRFGALDMSWFPPSSDEPLVSEA